MKTIPQTTELVNLGGSASAAAFNLMWPVFWSCGIDMGDQYVVIGGWDAENQMNTPTRKGLRKVSLYNDDGFVRSLPDLILARHLHACARFQNGNGDMVS